MSLEYEPSLEPLHAARPWPRVPVNGFRVEVLGFRGEDLGLRVGYHAREQTRAALREREFFIDNLLVRIHFIIEIIWWTGLAPWEFELSFSGSLISTFLEGSS